jgi:hypothetical protein
LGRIGSEVAREHTQIRCGLQELSREGKANCSKIGDAYEPAMHRARLVPHPPSLVRISIATGDGLQVQAYLLSTPRNVLSLELSSGGFSTGVVAGIGAPEGPFEAGAARVGGASEAASVGGARFSAMGGRVWGEQEQEQGQREVRCS